MPLERSYEPRPGYLYVKVTGSYDLEDSLMGISETLKASEANGLSNILIDFLELQGELPMLTEGYIYASKMAQQVVQHNDLTGQELRIAFVGPELRDVDAYSEKVAAEHGMNALIVTSDMDQALEWLGVEV